MRISESVYLEDKEIGTTKLTWNLEKWVCQDVKLNEVDHNYVPWPAITRES
jgi:hypothetical protein